VNRADVDLEFKLALELINNYSDPYSKEILCCINKEHSWSG